MGKDQPRVGRPRSERARTAVLHAVDDLLIETGYAALTMKGIAERAGVGRQTVYRWWSTKAEVLFEAAMTDAARELSVEPHDSAVDDFTAYLDAVTAFLTTSDAGTGYRALLGEAQHDPAVAEMMRSATLFDRAAATVISRAVDRGEIDAGLDISIATALLTGPLFYRLLTAGSSAPESRALAVAALTSIRALPEHVAR